MTQDVDSRIVDIGIDWLTLTIHREQPHWNEFLEAGEVMLNHIAEKGSNFVPKKQMQYEGAGNEHLFIGTHQNHAMLIARGKAAHEVAERFNEQGIECKCTRYDAQVTAEYAKLPQDWAATFRARVRCEKERSGTGRRVASAHYADVSRDTGITLGSRSSALYARIYHPKSKGHTDYSEKAVRFESEMKSHNARAAWSMFCNSNASNFTNLALVQGHLQTLGIRENWAFEGPLPRLEPDYIDKTQEKRLAWLKSTAQPVIKKLREDPEFLLLVRNWCRDMELGKFE